MSIRRNHRNGNQGTSSKARLARVRDKAIALRERIKRATLSFQERRQRHLAWWQRAFGVPMTGSRWLFSRVSALWVGLLSLIDLRPAQTPRSLRLSRSKLRATHRTIFRNMLHAEGLEARQLMAVDLSNLDLVEASDTGSSHTDNITNNTMPTVTVDYQNLTMFGDTIQLRDSSNSNALVAANYDLLPGSPDHGTVTLTVNSALLDGTHTLV
ncbi:MAG: Ig-like domain-containing protein, partial [Aureliella sp.]